MERSRKRGDSRTTRWRKKKARMILEPRLCCPYEAGIILSDGIEVEENIDSAHPEPGLCCRETRALLDVSAFTTIESARNVDDTSDNDGAHGCGNRNVDSDCNEGGTNDSDEVDDICNRDDEEDADNVVDSGSDNDDRDGDDGDGDDGDGDDGDGDDGDDGDGDGDDGDDGDGDGDNEDGEDISSDSDEGPPDDPHPSDSSGSDLSNDSSDDDSSNFNIAQAANLICESVNQCSVREVLALVLALSSRHSLTYEALVNLMKIINTIHGGNYLPVDKKALWRILGRSRVGITKFVYCPSCLTGHGRLRDLPDNVLCACGHAISKRTCKIFISLNVKKQLHYLLKRPEVRNALAQREQPAHGVVDMRDITDGQQYRRLRAHGNILASNDHFSYTFSTDGFHLAKSSSAEAWPLYMRFSELPWKLRQKYMLLAGVWVDLKHPNMNLFLEDFVQQANELSDQGVLWEREPGREVRSRFHPTCCVVDAQARCKMLNMSAPTGYFACPFCTTRGEQTGNGVHFPLPVPPAAVPERRTHDTITANMVEATLNQVEGQPVEGFKGASQLMLMDTFDLGRGVVTDDLHPFSGVIEHHLEILMTLPPRPPRPANGGRRPPAPPPPPFYIGRPRDIRRMDSRLRNIRTPTHISRKPRPFKTKARWKGSEWRNFLLYYLVPVLDGILPVRYLRHFQLLAQAVFIVSRDVVTEADCNDAHDLFHEYVTRFQLFFGPRHMRYNIHVLLHVVDCVRDWGPSYCHSTTYFESWNHELLKTITSPHGTAEQIVTRFLILRFLNGVEDDEQISDEIKREVRRILENPLLRDPVEIEDVKLLGRGTERRPTARERQILHDYNEDPNARFVEYNRGSFKGQEFRSARYRFAGEETKSDNSQVYTFDDEFGQILTIAALGNGEERRVRIFFRVHNTNALVNRYVCLVGNGPDVLELKRFTDLRGFAILCNTPRATYVMPVANARELD